MKPLETDTVIEGVKRIPRETPPDHLTESIMTTIKAGPVYQKDSWIKQVTDWLNHPLPLVLTPMRLIPAALVLFAILLAPVISELYFKRPDLTSKQGLATDTLIMTPQASTAAFTPTFPAQFVLKHPPADSVAVVGSFNNWKPDGYEMIKNPEGTWTLLVNLPEGRHYYCFLIDATRMTHDPKALLNEQDGFGTINSVLFLGSEYETIDS